MRIWLATEFTGLQPTKTAAVVVAPTKRRARAMLDQSLKMLGLQGFDGKLQPLNTALEAVHLLSDGNY